MNKDQNVLHKKLKQVEQQQQHKNEDVHQVNAPQIKNV